MNPTTDFFKSRWHQLTGDSTGCKWRLIDALTNKKLSALELDARPLRSFEKIPVKHDLCLDIGCYLRTGSGLPPWEEQTSWVGCPSTATGLTGLICGGSGGTNTVRLMDWACSSLPVPCSFKRHSKRPLSRS